jgi:hypothetical protein
MNMPITWALEIIDEDEYWMLHDLAKIDYTSEDVYQFENKGLSNN